MTARGALAVRPVEAGAWPDVAAIYTAGIATGNATFETQPPSSDDWDASHLPHLRFVATDTDGTIVGWAAARGVSDRCCYAGVVEHSVYVHPDRQSRGVGRLLLDSLIAAATDAGVWTVQTGIFPENTASVALHPLFGLVRRTQRTTRAAQRRLARRAAPRTPAATQPLTAWTLHPARPALTCPEGGRRHGAASALRGVALRRRPRRLVRRRHPRQPCRGVRRCGSAPVPRRRARHPEPGRHTHQPALQRRGHPGALYRYWSTPIRRPPHGPPIGRRPPRCHRRLGHPRRTPSPAPEPTTSSSPQCSPRSVPGSPLKARRTRRRARQAGLPDKALVVLSAAVGAVGGIYGIGGGSILAPILIGSGRPAHGVAPATLASTFVTSIAGVITFLVLAAGRHGSVAPDWGVGIALGAGGLAGAYPGARLQPASRNRRPTHPRTPRPRRRHPLHHPRRPTVTTEHAICVPLRGVGAGSEGGPNDGSGRGPPPSSSRAVTISDKLSAFGRCR